MGGPPLEFININLKMGGPPIGTISMDLAVSRDSLNGIPSGKLAISNYPNKIVRTLQLNAKP